MSFFRLSSKWQVAWCLCLLVAGCSQALYVPTEAHVTGTASLESLREGRKLYIRHCGSCHNLYTPKSHTHAQWGRQIEEMKVQAKITDQQAALIRLYVTGEPESR